VPREDAEAGGSEAFTSLAGLNGTKKAAPGEPQGRFLFEDASVELLCRASRSFLVRTPCDALSRPVPITLLVSGYLWRNTAARSECCRGVPRGPPIRFRFPAPSRLRLPRPPPPILVEARTSFSRAVVNKRTCWRVRLLPQRQIYSSPSPSQRFQLHLNRSQKNYSFNSKTCRSFLKWTHNSGNRSVSVICANPGAGLSLRCSWSLQIERILGNCRDEGQIKPGSTSWFIVERLHCNGLHVGKNPQPRTFESASGRGSTLRRCRQPSTRRAHHLRSGMRGPRTRD